MPDFVAATPAELEALKALRVARRLLRRVEVRTAMHRARVRVARTLKANRGMTTATELRFHAGITEGEARSLSRLVGALRGRRSYEKAVKLALERLSAKP